MQTDDYFEYGRRNFVYAGRCQGLVELPMSTQTQYNSIRYLIIPPRTSFVSRY